VEMELNGIKLDKDKWRIIINEAAVSEKELFYKISKGLQQVNRQSTLFDVPIINVGSNPQLLECLHKLGIQVPDTRKETLENFESYDIVKDIIEWRQVNKLITTYGEELISKINPKTGRLHTSFTQMVDTGRLSSSDPNLQNIPGKQKYRSCYIAETQNVLLTSDMQSAELKILGNVSNDPAFMEAYLSGLDLHTINASRIYGVSYDKVTKDQRKASKAISFGLVYGLSAHGLSARLRISKQEAEKLIYSYFKANSGVKNWLDKTKRDAVSNGYSSTISGRKRFYEVPYASNPDRRRIISSIERKAMNHPIQGSNADTVKQAMIYCFNALAQYGDKARLILTVHDEIIVECSKELVDEVAPIVSDSLIKGFGDFFTKIPMEADTLVSPCWMKGACEKPDSDGKKCGGVEFKFIPDDHYGTKLVCAKCGSSC